MLISRPSDLVRDPVTAYAEGVVSGRIVAGELVRHAGERHLRDLRDGPKRGLHWDLDAALRVIDWYPTWLTITAGEKAGQPFHLLPPHMFISGSLFGWKRADGRRRFRTLWFEAGKGQAKTPWMAATGLYLMRFCGIPRFEGYAVAGNESQSGLIIKDAAEMTRAVVPSEVNEFGEGPTVAEKADLQLRGTGDLTWQVEWDGAAYGLGTCKLRNVSSGSNISGPRPSLVMGDEIHEWDDRNILEMWKASIDKMPGDPLMLLGTNTPAVDQLIGLEQSDKFTQIAKGELPDDTSLAMIYTTDETDKPLEDEGCWRKSLPALDITFPSANIRDRVVTAKADPGEKNTLLRLYFGRRVGVSDAWITKDDWEAVLGDFTEADVRGLPCWYGLDLSSRVDMTALSAVWKRPDGHLFVKVWYWTPEKSMRERAKLDRAPYDLWAQAGHLIAVPGPTIGKEWPASKLKELHSENESQALAYDPAQILDFEEAASEVGLDMWLFEGPDKPAGTGLKRIRHGQGFKGMDRNDMLSMPMGVKELVDAILNRRITIHRNPVTNFCSVNMALKPGANPDQKVPVRRTPRARIDGMIAIIEGVNAARSTIGKGERTPEYQMLFVG